MSEESLYESKETSPAASANDSTRHSDCYSPLIPQRAFPSINSRLSVHADTGPDSGNTDT